MRHDACSSVYGVDMSSWRRSPVVAVVAMSLFLVVQLAIPISRVGEEGPRRFGWQMFSTAQTSPEFVVTTETGDEAIDLSDYMARERADIDLQSLLPSHLCSTVPGAISVTWEDGQHRC